MTREPARWATPSRRRPRPLRGLFRDIAAVSASAWKMPAVVSGGEPTHRSQPPAAPSRPGSLRGYLAPVAPRIRIDGPSPAQLPEGSVILVANHPASYAANLVLSRLAPERRSRTVLVAGEHERVPWSTRLVRPVIWIDPSDPGEAGARLRGLLQQGWSALLFPEGDPVAGAVKRPFHPFAAELGAELDIPVVPVGIRGARAVGASPGPARVSVRFGHRLETGTDARGQEAAVEALIAEDRATWWQVQRYSPDRLPGRHTPDSAHSWRHLWAQTAPPTKGGTTDSPRIWLSS